MNKKLFSWKALAGLALLVAMGMTSCKNTTEVDPNDPYNTTKPTKPSASTAGNADLTLTLSVPSDFASLWKNSVKDEVKEALAKKDEITIEVKTSGMKLAKDASVATNTLTLPDFFGGKADKIVNLVFNGAFAEVKSGLFINSAALAKDVVNITLPDNPEDKAYALTTTAGTSIPAISASSDAYISKLAVSGDAGKKGLSIGEGVNVARITESSDDYNLAGGVVAAVENDVATVNATFGVPVIYAGADGDGKDGVDIAQNGQKIYGVYAVNNTQVRAYGFTNDLDEIVIAKGKTVDLYGFGFWAWNHNDAPYVDEIIGLGDNSDLSKPANLSTVNVANFREFRNTSLVKNVVVTGGVNVASDIFEGVTFDCYADLNCKSVSDVTFNAWTTPEFYAKDAEFTFENVNFTSAATVVSGLNLIEAITDADDEQAYVIHYMYYDLDANDGTWKDAGEELDDVPAANKKLDKTGTTFTSADETAANNAGYSMITNAQNAHYWYCYIELLEEVVPDEDVECTINFVDCKVDNKAMTAKNLKTIFRHANPTNQITKVRINGILYQWKKSTTSGWSLVSVKE